MASTSMMGAVSTPTCIDAKELDDLLDKTLAIDDFNVDCDDG